MIVKPAEADGFAAKPPASLRVALVFGPDQGLVQERAVRLMKSVLPDINDPFRVSDLDDATLAADGARLFDEAASLSMLGGRRVVRVRGAGNNLAKLFERFLDDPPGEALVVVEAGDLAKGTSLRKLFEDDDSAAAIACYPDNARGLSDLVRDQLRAEGLSIAPDALEAAVAKLGGDRGTSRREIEKLAIYCHGAKQVTEADVHAAMGDEAEARMDDICDAAGTGNLPRLDTALERLWIEAVSPVALVRAAMGHFQRIALMRAAVDRGEGADMVMKRQRPPIHFTRANAIRAQVTGWTEARLLEALDLLLETEAQCKTTAVPAEAVCGRALFNIAAMARKR